jgi:MFS transporter, FHS family, L-fucose permease
MKRIVASRLLSLFALSALICLTVVLLGTGIAPMWALVLLGLFHSIMFPTIFALSLKHLGPHTKLGSSLLVMSIIGGAVFPAIMGYISDRSSIRYAFWVPFVCHLYVLYFATRGYRPDLDLPKGAGVPSVAVEN